MRPTCLFCAMKHVVTAAILLREYRTGYENRWVFAAAELEQASQETEQDFPHISRELYAERKNLEADPENYREDLTPYVDRMLVLIDKHGLRPTSGGSEGDPDGDT